MSLLLQLFDDMVGLLDPELQPTSSKAEVVCVRTHVCMCWLVHVCVCMCVVLMLGTSTVLRGKVSVASLKYNVCMLVCSNSFVVVFSGL